MNPLLRQPLVKISATLLLAAFSTSANTAYAQWAWTEATPLPSPRQEIYATTQDGRIFTAGGLTDGATVVRDDFLAYDPQTDHWETLAALPSALHHVTLSAWDGVIYAVGGFSGGFPDWKPEASVSAYDIDSAEWGRVTELPVARGEHASHVLDGRLYVISGRVGGTESAGTYAEHRDTSRVDIFDLRTNQWSRGPDAPTARNSAASAVIDGKIYVVGGRQYLEQQDGTAANVNVASLEVYDPKTGLWSVKAPIPQATGAPAAAALNGKLYVFGGEQWVPTQTVFGEAWVYDPSTDHWAKRPDLNSPRHGLAGAAIGSSLYAIGGATKTGAGDVNSMERLLKIKDEQGG